MGLWYFGSELSWWYELNYYCVIYFLLVSPWNCWRFERTFLVFIWVLGGGCGHTQGGAYLEWWIVVHQPQHLPRCLLDIGTFSSYVLPCDEEIGDLKYSERNEDNWKWGWNESPPWWNWSTCRALSCEARMGSFDYSSWCRGTGVDWPHQIRGMWMKKRRWWEMVKRRWEWVVNFFGLFYWPLYAVEWWTTRRLSPFDFVGGGVMKWDMCLEVNWCNIV